MSRLVDGEWVCCPKAPPAVKAVKRNGVRQQSEKRISEKWERNETIKCVSFRANGMCQATAIAPAVRCSVWGWTAHELVQRSVRPGSHLEPDLCIFVCGIHHRMIDEDDARARQLGLIRDSWEVDERGQLKPFDPAAGLKTKDTQP